jgi:carboxyl-terminal processing protease
MGKELAPSDMSSRLRTALLGLIIFTGFFVAGFAFNDVRAAAGSGRPVTTALLAIPDRMEMLLEKPAGPKVENLPVRTTYQETLNTILEKFYPEASVLETTVVKTPTNSVTGKVETQKPSLNVQQLTYMAIRGILGSLDDPYTGFLDPEDYKKMREENEGNFVGIGAQLNTNKQGQVYVKEPLPGCPAIKAGVRKGDIILKVDGKSVADMDIEQVVKMIRGPENTKVTLTLQRAREPKPIEITIVRQVVDYRMVEYDLLDPQNGIGWLQLRQFNSKADAQMDAALTDLEKKNLKALILDLRGNPGGLLESAVDIGSRFIESGPVVIIQERQGRRSALEVDPSKHDHRTYPLVVLVDEFSASASEIVAGAIKDNQVGTLIGNKTFGKGRVQTVVPMPGDAAVRITTAKYLTPKGTDIHKVGIQPDIVVQMPEPDTLPDDADLEADRLKYDPQLRKAVDFLREKLASMNSGGTQARR